MQVSRVIQKRAGKTSSWSVPALSPDSSTGAQAIDTAQQLADKPCPVSRAGSWGCLSASDSDAGQQSQVRHQHPCELLRLWCPCHAAHRNKHSPQPGMLAYCSLAAAADTPECLVLLQAGNDPAARSRCASKPHGNEPASTPAIDTLAAAIASSTTVPSPLDLLQVCACAPYGHLMPSLVLCLVLFGFSIAIHVLIDDVCRASAHVNILHMQEPWDVHDVPPVETSMHT